MGLELGKGMRGWSKLGLNCMKLEEKKDLIIAKWMDNWNGSDLGSTKCITIGLWLIGNVKDEESSDL